MYGSLFFQQIQDMRYHRRLGEVISCWKFQIAEQQRAFWRSKFTVLVEQTWPLNLSKTLLPTWILYEMRSKRDNFIETSIDVDVKHVDCWHWQIDLEINIKVVLSLLFSWYQRSFWYSSSSRRVEIPSDLPSGSVWKPQFRWNSTKMQKDWYQIQANVNSAEETFSRSDLLSKVVNRS